LDAPGVLVAYSIAVPCVAGLMHLTTIRHLPDESRREAVSMR
jgi:hypothetical protein